MTILPTQSHCPSLTTEEAGKFALPSARKGKQCAKHMAWLGHVTHGVKVLNRISPVSRLERDNQPNRKMGQRHQAFARRQSPVAQKHAKRQESWLLLEVWSLG